MSAMHRKACASLRIVRIRRMQDRIALMDLHQAQETQRTLEVQQSRIWAAQQSVQPDAGGALAQNFAARLRLSNHLNSASVSLQSAQDQAQRSSDQASAARRITHQGVHQSELYAEKMAREAAGDAERRAAQILITRKPRP
jgi:hypothetical protein